MMAILALLAGAIVVAALVISNVFEGDDPEGPERRGEAPTNGGARADTPDRGRGEAEGGAAPIEPTAAASFDPPPGDGAEHPETVALALDPDPESSWTTETYESQDLGAKPGVGIYADAGEPMSVGAIALRSDTPGWRMEVYGSAGSDPPDALGGWRMLVDEGRVGTQRTVSLPSEGTQWRYYLIWITHLAPSEEGGFLVQITDLELQASPP